MLIIKGTDEQVKQMFINAINASFPIGMGVLNFEDKDYTVKDIETKDIYVADYFHGRMVKTRFVKGKLEEGSDKFVWIINGPNPPNPEYQGWSNTYPTWKELAATVGITVVEMKDRKEDKKEKGE